MTHNTWLLPKIVSVSVVSVHAYIPVLQSHYYTAAVESLWGLISDISTFISIDA